MKSCGSNFESTTDKLSDYVEKDVFSARVAVSPSNVNVSLECVINGAVLPESQHATAILAK